MTTSSVSAGRLWQLVYEALDQSGDIVILVEKAPGDDGGVAIVAVNQAFLRTTGYTESQLFGQPLLGLVSPEAVQSAEAALTKAALYREPLRTELPCLTQSGTLFWLGLHLMPVGDAESDHFVLLGRDITEVLRARHQATAVQGLLAKVFVCIDMAIAIIGTDGRILMTNPSFDRLLGYKPSTLIGLNSLEVVAPSARASAAAARQRQIANGKSYTIETKLLKCDGSEVVVNLSAILAERNDLKRFRIVTVVPAPTAGQPMRVQVAGKIKLIGLEEIRSALGERWPAAAERAMAVAEHIIRQRCGPRDNFGRTEDNGFMICFADASEEEAAFLAAMIARDIRNRLIGQGENPSVAHVSAVTASVSVPDLPNQSIAQVAGLIEERMNARLSQIESTARENLKAALDQARCEMEAIHGRDLAEIVAQFARLPAALERKIQSALAALPAKEREDLNLDRLMLSLATEEATRGLLDGKNQPVLVTVDFETFLVRHRADRYIEACQKLDTRLRRRLFLVLTELPDGIPRSRVLDCITRLRPFCRGVGFAVSTLEAPPVDLANGGVPIVVASAENLQGPDRGALVRLIGTLHAHRARLLIRHVASREAASSLIAAGVDLISFAG